MSQIRETAEIFQRILRLKSFPVGIKLCQRPEELSKGKVPTEKLSLCQMVKLASQGKWQLSCPKDKMGCFTAQLMLGFRPQSEKDIEHHIKQFTDNREIAENILVVKPKFKTGEIEGILVGPLENFEPDVAVLIIDSAQALPLLEAYGLGDWQRPFLQKWDKFCLMFLWCCCFPSDTITKFGNSLCWS